MGKTCKASVPPPPPRLASERTLTAREKAGMNLFSDFIAKEAADPAAALAPNLSLVRAPAGSTHRITVEQSIGGGASEWRPVPFKQDTSKGTCFGCEYGMCRPDATQPSLAGLWKLFRDNYGVMINTEIAKLMAEYFAREIKPPMVAAGHDIEWTAQQILLHIETHMLEPTVNASTAIQNFRQIARWLRDQVRVKNSKGTKRVDLKSLRSLIEVENIIQRLYAGKSTKQLFYSDYFKLDDRRSHQQG